MNLRCQRSQSVFKEGKEEDRVRAFGFANRTLGLSLLKIRLHQFGLETNEAILTLPKVAIFKLIAETFGARNIGVKARRLFCETC